MFIVLSATCFHITIGTKTPRTQIPKIIQSKLYHTKYPQKQGKGKSPLGNGGSFHMVKISSAINLKVCQSQKRRRNQDSGSFSLAGLLLTPGLLRELRVMRIWGTAVFVSAHTQNMEFIALLPKGSQHD